MWGEVRAHSLLAAANTIDFCTVRRDIACGSSTARGCTGTRFCPSKTEGKRRRAAAAEGAEGCGRRERHAMVTSGEGETGCPTALVDCSHPWWRRSGDWRHAWSERSWRFPKTPGGRRGRRTSSCRSRRASLRRSISAAVAAVRWLGRPVPQRASHGRPGPAAPFAARRHKTTEALGRARLACDELLAAGSA